MKISNESKNFFSQIPSSLYSCEIVLIVVEIVAAACRTVVFVLIAEIN